MSGARFLVSGKVQGVWFRASARNQALAFGLTGVARNLEDGRVEVIAFGTEAALDELARWLAVGPPLAQVRQVLREPVEAESADIGFRVA